MKLQLLSNQKSNHKIGKNKNENFIIWSLNLRPYKTEINGKLLNLCPFATKSCAASCVGDNGHFSMRNGSAYKAQIRKTALYFTDKNTFYQLLYNEIDKCRKYADKKGATAVFRLNAYSDIDHSKQSKRYTGECIYNKFNDCLFYDYTKDVKKFISSRPVNYSLTYSWNEDTAKHIKKQGFECEEDFLFETMHIKKMNIAIVFETVPDVFNDFQVIDGDETDNRFLDVPGVIVGLKFKGSKKKLLSAIAGGFCIPNYTTAE